MRRRLAEMLIPLLVAGSTASADTDIHAPVPPYCSPRGNWADCPAAPDPQLTSVVEYSAEDLSDLVKIEQVVRVESERAFGVAGGYAKLVLRWTTNGRDPSGVLAVVSRRKLIASTAEELVSRYRSTLDAERVVELSIERFNWPWQDDPRPDWCELSRPASDKEWLLECGVEQSAPHNKRMQTDEPWPSP